MRTGLVASPVPTELGLVNFREPALGLANLLVRCDKDLGGFSTADLSVVESDSTSNHAFGRFKGDLSLDLPADRPDIIRLGYAMFRTKDIEPKLFGLASSEYWNWEPYNQMVLRVRGDRRKYFINVQAESAYPTDLYQHRLFLKTPGQWEEVTVPLGNFILTNGGIIQQQQAMELSQVKSVGIGLIDRQYGPYQLDIDWIKVVTGDGPLKPAKPTKPSSADLTPGKRLSIDD
ncbi:hypothetical protein AWJ20_4677 [Sugiyamaella lignohabitans]|uniref:NADH:ubiquinone oxidoreductase intermediate-associated protein 30 domain-containing protein n=1 Tax=Sugiyamaella lignohabitans TaxID=796027 RepID=A0A167E7F8_9ASCO|nr:uncharacterized protein AWJ20_4677 [Sugiyamaella lignohabitans]ANB13733.1 hypothetical protein AWJ20_4677 [Sugiyamaella lignohabitans]